MARLLGEILLQSGVIDERQLQGALDAQLIYGGHLGTCLIELGHLDETELGQVLAELHTVKYAPPELFQNIPDDVIAMVPRAVIEKHPAIPFGETLQGLHVALMQPRDLTALDEISFASGHRIVPWVAPEARIVQAMERYYGVRRKLRYVTLCRELDRMRSGGTGTATASTRPHQPGSDHATVGLPLAAADAQAENVDLIAQMLSGTLPSSGRGKRAVTDETQDDPFQPLTRLVQISDGLDSEPHGAAQTAQVETVAQDAPASPADRMCGAETGEELGSVVLAQACRTLHHGMLFLVKGNGDYVCLSRGIELDADQQAGVEISTAVEQAYQLLCGHLNYCGPLPEEDGFQGFYNALDLDFPAEIVVLPVYLQNRQVALFYGDRGREPILPGQVEEYSRLMKRFALGLQMVILKRKIRTT